VCLHDSIRSTNVATVDNPQWASESDTYVTVQGKLKSTTVDLGQYNGLEEIILGFPFDESTGISLPNAGVFTTIDGGAIIDTQRMNCRVMR